MNPPILVTGATGNVGAFVAAALRAEGASVRPASRSNTDADGVRLDFTDSATWDAAFEGVRSMLLVRPPAIANIRRDLVPALSRACALGVRHVVLLSVQGAGRVPVLPHAAIERWLRRSGMEWTFVRPSYFDQNLTTVFRADIRDRAELMVPAGRGRTAFVDARDVGEVVTRALLDPEHHIGRAWTPTGEESLTWFEVAAVLTEVLGRPITYRRPSLRAYVRHARSTLGFDPAMTATTTVIHATARLGLAGHLTGDLRRVTGRAPTTLREFAERERAAWEHGSDPQA